MDLGLKGRKAIVCAASKGLGRGCAVSLAREGVEVTILARGREALEATAAEIRRLTGATVHTLVCDITTAEGRAAALAAVPAPDILVNNAGGPPAGDFRDWDEQAWQTAVNANMITPIMLMKAVVDGMIARRFGRIVNITSTSVKAPIPHLGLSNGARAGLTGFVAGLARQVAHANVTINNLLPGPFDTDRLRSTFAALAKRTGEDETLLFEKRKQDNPSKRYGTAEEFGEFCAFMCSAQASYFTGQNVVLDGGAYPGTF
jgi:3-oxoacyl-[acyl-carrier protein] reductase